MPKTAIRADCVYANHPYRKDDFTAEGDAIIRPYFAGHGYASIRLVSFEPAEGARPLEVEVLRMAHHHRSLCQHVVKGFYERIVFWDAGRRRLGATGLEMESTHKETYRIIETAPLAATAQFTRR